MNKLKALWAKVKTPLWWLWQFAIAFAVMWMGTTAVIKESTPLAIFAAVLFMSEFVLPTISKSRIEMNSYHYYNIDEELMQAVKAQGEANCPDKVEPKAEA